MTHRRPLLHRLGVLLFAGMLLAGCELDITDPGTATEDDVLGTAEGVQALAVGLQEYWATTALSSNVLVPGVSGRELAINTTFANLIELEAGGTALPTSNGSVLQLWSRNYRAIAMAEQLIDAAPDVNLEPGTRRGVLALAHLYKAMALGHLAQNFEQAVLSTDRDEAQAFVPRQQVFEEAVDLLDAAVAVLADGTSAAFESDVLAPGLDLENTIRAYRARYLLLAGRYDDAIVAANAVDPAATSLFTYDDQSQNPIFGQIVRDDDYLPRDRFGTPLTSPFDARIEFWMDPAERQSDPNGYPVEGIDGFYLSAGEAIPAYLPDEMALIRAEAHLRQGDLDEAVAEIDAVRTQPAQADPFGIGAGLTPYGGPMTAEAIEDELFAQRRAELFMQGFGLEDARRLDQPGPDPSDPFARTRNFYPYPDQERLNNPNTPADPAI